MVASRDQRLAFLCTDGVSPQTIYFPSCFTIFSTGVCFILIFTCMPFRFDQAEYGNLM